MPEVPKLKLLFSPSVGVLGPRAIQSNAEGLCQQLGVPGLSGHSWGASMMAELPMAHIHIIHVITVLEREMRSQGKDVWSAFCWGPSDYMPLKSRKWGPWQTCLEGAYWGLVMLGDWAWASPQKEVAIHALALSQACKQGVRQSPKYRVWLDTW